LKQLGPKNSAADHTSTAPALLAISKSLKKKQSPPASAASRQFWKGEVKFFHFFVAHKIK
jgi:hypothetical protein